MVIATALITWRKRDHAAVINNSTPIKVMLIQIGSAAPLSTSPRLP